MSFDKPIATFINMIKVILDLKRDSYIFDFMNGYNGDRFILHISKSLLDQSIETATQIDGDPVAIKPPKPKPKPTDVI